MPRHSPYAITLTTKERDELEALARRYTSSYRDVVRAKIVLYAAAGLRNDEIGARLDTPRQIVSKWRKRFAHERLAGLVEQSRAGSKKGVGPRPPADPDSPLASSQAPSAARKPSGDRRAVKSSGKRRKSE
jgi:hypothetical protein